MGLATRGVQTDPTGKGFRPDIQGLRAIAVALVVFYHAGVPGLRGGFVGVDVFFVISGYLIVGLVMKEIDGTGTLSLTRFWARRIRRLLPASSIVLVATAIVAKILLPPLAMVDVAKDAVATSLYFINVRLALTGTDYLSNRSPSPFQHYWSLATEEQFYVIFPLAALAIVKLTRSPRLWTGALLVACVILSFALCVGLTATRQPYAFFTLPARAWELAIGGCLAVILARGRTVAAPVAASLGWAGVAAIVLASVLLTEGSAFPGWLAAIPALGCAALIASGALSAGPLQRLLSARPLIYIGDRSYSLYLWHWPVLVFPLTYSAETAAAWWIRALLVVLAVALAAATYRLVEDPIRHAGPRMRRPVATYGMGVTITAAGVVIGMWAGTLTTLNAGRPAVANGAGPVMSSTVSAHVPTGLRPTLEAAADDDSRAAKEGCLVSFLHTESPDCVFGDGAADESIVVLGDSHAESWVPPLERIAAERQMRLIVLTKASCPAADVASWQVRLNRPFDECVSWRRAALDRIREIDPAVVVIADFDRERLIDPNERTVAEGVTRTLQVLPSGTRSFWLADNPAFDVAVPVCLSGHLEETEACGAAPREALRKSRIATEEAAVTAAGGTFVDTSEWLCLDTLCPVVSGSHLMYRDRHHLTATYSATLAPELGAALFPSETG